MRVRRRVTLILVALVTAAVVASSVVPASSQAQARRRAAHRGRQAEFTGIWQAMNTANWDIQAHPEARRGPVVPSARPSRSAGGPGVVEGDEIPYLPAARRRRRRTPRTGWRATPKSSATCRASRARPTCRFRFRSCSRRTLLMAYEFTSASRIIRMNTQGEEPGAGVDGMVGRPLGRRHARRRRDRPDGGDLVRPRRQLPQRRAPRRRALYVRRSRTR